MKGVICLWHEQPPLHISKCTIAVLCHLHVANTPEYSSDRLHSATVPALGNSFPAMKQPLPIAQVKAILAQ